MPAYIAYLGDILPSAIIAMLVVYCLKDLSLAGSGGRAPGDTAGCKAPAVHNNRQTGP